MQISAVINTKNSSATLQACLESVKWVDEIVVVDMHSTDQTVEIAKKFTQKVFTYKDVGYVEPARNFAIQKAKGKWVLVIDADEEVSDTLREYIQALLGKEETEKVAAFAIPRKNIVFGGWLSHAGWWPDYQLRLFQPGAVTWKDEIHSVPKVTGRSVQLPADEKLALIHHNYPTVEEFITRLNRYTTKEVESRSTAQITSKAIVGGFRTELMSRLFMHKGIDGGVRGVSVSFMQAMYEVVVRLKQWESQGHPKTDHLHETLVEVHALQQDLAYWIANWQVQHSKGVTKFYWVIRRKLKL